jgi:hypothetical protein
VVTCESGEGVRVLNLSCVFGGGVFGSVGRGCGSSGRVRLCSMVSRWVLILCCQFSSFSVAILASGDESMSCSRFCSWVLIAVGGVLCGNCVSMTRLACCSFIVSAKSSSGNVLYCGACAVLVRSRYFSTRLSSFLMRSAAPGGSGADRCFCGSYVVTNMWSLSWPGSGSSSSYSPDMCRMKVCPLGLRYLL